MVNNNRNVYIMNLEAAYIYKNINDGVAYSTSKMNQNYLYSAAMPYSLEIYRAKKRHPEEFYQEDDKSFTKMFINITFDEDYKIFEVLDITDEKEKEDKLKTYSVNKKVKKKYKLKKKISKARIRDHIYTKGINVNGERYCFYKRGSNKAKSGSDIFIKEQYYEEFIKRSRLGLNVKETKILGQKNSIDMPSLRAYEALIMSGIEFTIDIKPNEILLIDDIYGKEFSFKASVTSQVKGKLKTKNKSIKKKNCLTDGQGLLDESVFKQYGKSDKSFFLLRSDWLKCCAFNTKLREYWSSEGKTEIEEKLNGQSTGRILKCDEIKLVITPNSLKWLKMEFMFKKQNNPLTSCYIHWLSNIDDIFGVVKYDKLGNYGRANRSTYQLLNSLPLSYDDVKELAQEEITYVNNLKNDFAYFKQYIGQHLNDTEELEESIDYVIHYNPKAINVEEQFDNDIILDLLKINSNFRYTKKFKDWKSKQIGYYKDNLKHGKLRMQNTLYCTLFCNPFSMLQATVGDYAEGKVSQVGREVWCRNYAESQQLCATRNPHLCSGNVMHLTNKYHDEYKYFNLSDLILVINANDNDILDRAQGADVDSDQFLLLPQKILVEKACICEKEYPTPVNMIKGTKKSMKNTNKNLAKVDNILNKNYIGKICNKAQIVQSYMFDAIASGKDKKLIIKYYDICSLLSSLSQIEIDKAKKPVDSINMYKELKLIDGIKWNYKPVFQMKNTTIITRNGSERTIQQILCPNFFKVVAKGITDKFFVDEGFQCPMEYLQIILDKEIKKTEATKIVDFKELLIKQKGLEHEQKPNTKQYEPLVKIIKEYDRVLKSVNIKNNKFSKRAAEIIKANAKKIAINKLEDKVITNSTILTILRMAFKVSRDKIGFSQYSMNTLKLLYYSNKFKTLNCFLTYETAEKYLVKDEKGDIDIFGEKYKEILISKGDAA